MDDMIRRHFKLCILIALELVFAIGMIAGSFGEPKSISFAPGDFIDNIQERPNIVIGSGGISLTYDEDLAVYDDEGRIIGDDLLTGKFAIGSGAYDVSVHYEAEADNAYVELFSESWVTETVSSKIFLTADKEQTSSKLYIPFGRSMHDVQMNIHYMGPGELTVYAVELKEDIRYRWDPVAGYLLLLICLDFLLWLVFAVSGHTAREYVKRHYEIPALVGIVILASLPSFADFLYVGHDMEFHLARIVAVSHEISYGQFPVRMLTDMLQGYSYPTSTFYCDFFLYPFALLYLLGLPLRMCWQMYVITVNVLTALLSYHVFRYISKSRDIGIIGTAVYTLSAYRIVDIYLRSAMGEFTAMTFIPLIVVGIWMLYYEHDTVTPVFWAVTVSASDRCKSDIKSSFIEDDVDAVFRRGWFCLGLGMSAIALCHLLSIEMISLFLVIFCLMEYKKTFTKPVMIAIGKAALMTVLLSCWFIMPMLLTMRAIPLSMYDHQTYIQAEGAYPTQVFNIFMRGTGYSTTATPMEMPLSIGGGMTSAFAMLIFTMISKGYGDRHRQKVVFVLTSLSLVLSMYFFPWDSIAGITDGRMEGISRLARMVQYPWRFLEITTVVLSVAAVCMLRRYMDSDYGFGYRCKLWTGILLLGTVISLGAFYDPFINEADWTRATDEHYLDKSIGREEYLPSDSGRLIDLPGGVESVEDDGVEIRSYEAAGGERRLELACDGGDSSVLIPLFAYPGYHAEDIATLETIETGSGDNARLCLQIPAGYHGTVRVYYREPWYWRVFEVISVIAFIGYGISILRA